MIKVILKQDNTDLCYVLIAIKFLWANHTGYRYRINVVSGGSSFPEIIRDGHVEGVDG